MRRLAGNTAVYAAADLIAKGGAYALIPILTHGLSAQSFGIYSLVISIVPALTIVASLGLGGAVTRLWFDLDGDARKRFQLAAWLTMLISALAVALSLTLAARPLFGALFPGLNPALFVWGVWVSFFLSSATVPLAILRAEEQARRFAILSASQFLGPAIAVVIALAGGSTATGVLQAHVFGSMVVLALSAAFMAGQVARPADWSAIRPALALGLPIVPHLMAHWALNVADRVAIQRTLGVAFVGLYTVGYQIAQGVSLIATALNNAAVPAFYRAAGRGRREALGRAWAPMLYVLGAFSVGVALFGEEAVSLLAPGRYAQASAFIPWVALGYWLLAAYYFPVNALFYAKRVRMIPVATLTAAVTNYLLNIWLLPRYGLIAAAWNTAIAYGVLLAIVAFAAQRVFPLPYRTGRAAAICALGASVYALSATLPEGAPGTVLKVPLLLIYLAGGFALVRSEIAAVRTAAGGGAAAPAPAGDEPRRVFLAPATTTQARSMAACAPALRDAGFQPVFVSLDPVAGKDAARGLHEAGVEFTAVDASGGTVDLLLRGREAARKLVAGAAAVVIGNDFTPFERLIVEQAGRAGCASVLLQDGVIALEGEQAGGGARSGSPIVTLAKRILTLAGFPFQPKPYGTAGCDVICVYGPSTRDALIRRGVPAGSIAVTGQPRYDTLARSPADARPRDHGQIVLVTTQPFSRYGLATLEQETQTFAAMIDAALTDGGRPVVVKLHPDTDDASRGELTHRYSQRVDFQQHEPIEALYRRAAALVTLSSTTALEAMLYGVPVVVVDAPGFPSTLPYAESGAVATAGSTAGIGAALREAIEGAHGRKEAVKRFLDEHLAALDGRAAGRVAAAITARIAAHVSVRDASQDAQH